MKTENLSYEALQPGILLDRRTNCFSDAEAIRAEMEDYRERFADQPEFLARLLSEMEEDLAFAEELHKEPATT